MPDEKKTFHGRQAEVYVADAIERSELDSDTPIDEQLDDATETVYTGDVMNIEISDPEASVEVENTFGGQFKQETPADGVEIDVTMRFRDLEVFEEMHGDAEDVGSTDFRRIEGSEEPGSRTERLFVFELQDGDDVLRYAANKALFQQFGDVSLDADGFAEISGVVMTLIEDRIIEQNF